MKVHDELKKFKCEVCLKKFSGNAYLIKHSRTHTGEKPFTCQTYDKKFAQKSNLVQNLSTHSDVRKCKCSVCPEGRYFKTNS